LHWEDVPDWWDLNLKSYRRLKQVMTGKSGLGIYGIGSEDLFKEYQSKIEIDLTSQDYDI
jgi:hypothetical protein